VVEGFLAFSDLVDNGDDFDQLIQMVESDLSLPPRMGTASA
jgi:hypothetical protein